MNELALFAGAGGGILGGTILGWRTVCAVEIEPYPASVLVARQNDGILPPFPIWDDVCTFDGKPWRGIVDVISGGFPCQDVSIAGKGAGLEGAKSGLWSEMRRIISEVRPRYVLVENSPMLTIRGGPRVIADLTEMGYSARWGVIGAADAGALHERNRLWIVAHTDRAGLEECDMPSKPEGPGLDPGKDSPRPAEFPNTQSERCGPGREGGFTGDTSRKAKLPHRGEMADTDNPIGGGKLWRERSGKEREAEWYSCPAFDQPEPVRMVDGVAARVDRLKAAGNGQVPAVVRIAWHELKGD